MILPGVVEARDRATPLSMRATSTPMPVYPAFHHAWAPVSRVMLYIEFMSAAGSDEPAPQLTPAQTSASATVTVAARPTRHLATSRHDLRTPRHSKPDTALLRIRKTRTCRNGPRSHSFTWPPQADLTLRTTPRQTSPTRGS